MVRGPRKYPAQQEFLDAARKAGYTDSMIDILDVVDSYYPRGGYQRTEIPCTRIRLENGPQGMFKKSTGALYKGVSYTGSKLTKGELLRHVEERSPAALAQKLAEEKAAVEQQQQEQVDKVWDNYTHQMELEKLAIQRAIQVAMESGLDRGTATDVVLSLLDSGVLERIADTKKERIRAAEGWMPRSSYKRGTWADGKLVQW